MNRAGLKKIIIRGIAPYMPLPLVSFHMAAPGLGQGTEKPQRVRYGDSTSCFRALQGPEYLKEILAAHNEILMHQCCDERRH